MSSTRRVETGEQRRQNGWASAEEYDDLRGLNGTAVALRATLLDDPKDRELLYFIQALSPERGLKKLARQLLEMFPDRVGTPAMHDLNCKKGKRLTLKQYKEIECEMAGRTVFDEDDCIEELLSDNYTRATRDRNAATELADDLINRCWRLADELHYDLEDICVNPKRRIVVTHFKDIHGALHEYKKRYEEKARADFVETSIGKIVIEALDYVLDTGRTALIEGNSGYGKSTAVRAWCEMHLGRVRYVQLTGITTRTQFFKKVAKALGIAKGGGMSSGKVQSRVEDFFQRTKMILVIDEGQYLWPQGKRIESHPELINWLNTACYNEGVPYAISATSQFTLRRQHVERSTDWSSEQLRRRTRRVFRLPVAPVDGDTEALARMKNDLLLVASKRLGGLGQACVDYVVGYALSSKGYFQAITDAIEDAELIARRAGRDRFVAKDLKAAISDWRAPSDAALQRVFDTKASRGRKGRPSAAPHPDPEEQPAEQPAAETFRAHSSRLQAPCRPPETGLPKTRQHEEPVLAG